MNPAAAWDAASSDSEIARRFVCARLQARALDGYPGALPRDLEQAYARQDAAIGLWPDRVAGWKVGKIPEAWVAPLGEERLVGPIFAGHVRRIGVGECAPLAVIDGGFAAVEAEYVFVLRRDAPTGKADWSLDEAADMVAALHLGIEFAGSPLASINALGPAVVVSDFGNNAGLLLGPELLDWRTHALDALRCTTFIGERAVGHGGAAFIAGGPLAALAFALARNARRKRPLRAGDLISTGASTGIHDIRVGERARVEFAGGITLHCRAERAQARSQQPREDWPC